MKVANEAKDNTELQIEYEKIRERVRQTKESVIRMNDRHFTAETDEIEGTVESATAEGIRLSEYPGRLFKFSSVGTSAADLSACVLGEQNTRSLRPAATKKPRARGREESRLLRSSLADISLWAQVLSAVLARRSLHQPLLVSGRIRDSDLMHCSLNRCYVLLLSGAGPGPYSDPGDRLRARGATAQNPFPTFRFGPTTSLSHFRSARPGELHFPYLVLILMDQSRRT
jgi:hypothetical protein